MRIALLGYGRMGREIEKVALAGGHEIVVRTDIGSQELFNHLTASTGGSGRRLGLNRGRYPLSR